MKLEGISSVIFVVNHLAFFVSHRLPIALSLIEKGVIVRLIVGQPGSATMEAIAQKDIEALDIPYDRLNFTSDGMNIFKEFGAVIALIRLLRSHDNALLHCVSPKGVLYGGVAGRICGVKRVVFAISGMGFIATESKEGGLKRSVLKNVYSLVLRFIVRSKRARVIVQNAYDEAVMQKMAGRGLENVRLIKGSGVNCSQYDHARPFGSRKTVLFPARLLKDKGVVEFVKAAEIVKSKHPTWRFVLAGALDYSNPSAIDIAMFQSEIDKGVIECLGHVEDMVALYADASIVCLPSYREGLPKVLIEAAASSCAVITTNTIGCRDAVLPGITGEVVPVRDHISLSVSIENLIDNPLKREAYGRAGKEFAEAEFSLSGVIQQTFEIYHELI